MTKQDAYQMSLLAHLEICCNIMIALAVPNSRRHNLLKKIQSQFEHIDNTYRGYLPEDWIIASREFELRMQEQLKELLERLQEGKPVVEPQAPQAPIKEKIKEVKSGGCMKEQLDIIEKLIDNFKVDAAKQLAGNKSAGVRARKGSLELARQLKAFRALSVAAA
jgi:hypothetical protein